MMNDYDLRPKPAERQLTATEKAIIIQNMNLRDADSARFRWLPFDPSKSHYCGWVNAKNAFGGYTGFQPFEASIQTDDKGHITNSYPAWITTPEVAAIRTMCSY